MKLSIIICTYNREFIISHCLASLSNQTIKSKNWEVIIINNKSTDNTQVVIDQFTSIHSNFKSFIEEKQGLSHARNRGYKEAQSDWVIYIDDDAKVRPNFIERVLWIIENYDFDCFGGMFYAWYLYGKPKWVPKEFENMTFLRKGIGVIDGSNGWLCGGNFAIKKDVLQKIGGFDSNFGMTGDNLGYGEEDFLQRRLFDMGFKIGFDPDLIIYHAVSPHKLKLNWHLKSAYQHGKTREMLFRQKRNIILPFFELIKSTLGFFLKRFPLGLYQLLFDKHFFWQNLILDSLQPILFLWGGFSWNIESTFIKKAKFKY